MVVVFTNTQLKLFSGSDILRFCEAPFPFVFVLFSLLAVLFALFPA